MRILISVTPLEAVEFFHLQFLRVLAVGPDKSHYIVKGGCNLRFFFKSIRYSEDLDLDVHTTAPATLRNKVDKILGSGALPKLLLSRDVSIASASQAKQTDTTQRWKIGLVVAGSERSIPTKIEFSRRETDPDHGLEAVDATIAHALQITPPLVEHYRPGAAFRQKVAALIGRKEVQARDVFDLHLLLALLPVAKRPSIDRATSRAATDRLLEISYDDFVGQVVAYLEPDHQEIYANEDAWEQMQTDVASALAPRP